jgi:transposase InsO family protein
MDLLVVPSARFRLLYAWFVIGHGRREIIHFGVTEHPTSSWVVQQLREAFPDETAPRFLIFDNDSIFSERVTEMIDQIGIEPRRTAFRSPWQNGIAECRPSPEARIVGLPRVGGLHHRYEWQEAA